jgi:uncharacterized protein (TIGR00369 family)
MTLTLADAEKILADNFAPWVVDLGLRVEEAGPEGATLRLPFSARLTRIGGTLCGQALMALADTAMVFAVAGASGGFRPMTTVGQTISFLRPIAGADAIATARLLRLGKTLAFGEILIRAHDRDDVAGQVSTTYAILGPVAGSPT